MRQVSAPSKRIAGTPTPTPTPSAIFAVASRPDSDVDAWEVSVGGGSVLLVVEDCDEVGSDVDVAVYEVDVLVVRFFLVILK